MPDALSIHINWSLLFLLLVNEFSKKDSFRNKKLQMHNKNCFWKAASTLTGKYFVPKLILKIKTVQFGNGNVLCDFININTARLNLIGY